MADGGWYYYGVWGAANTPIVHLNTVDKNSIFIYFWARTTVNYSREDIQLWVVALIVLRTNIKMKLCVCTIVEVN